MKEEQLREIVYRNWKNGDEVGLYEEVKKLMHAQKQEIKDAVLKLDTYLPNEVEHQMIELDDLLTLLDE